MFKNKNDEVYFFAWVMNDRNCFLKFPLSYLMSEEIESKKIHSNK